ncbi:hypothetical protein BDA96_02G431100 [Sorghum bicolor]|uniref:Uncharacterized protein n=2 Tax=Sorghum bicolor TaxID=4558 RepID=A0A921UVF3_SORBI|nr:hypothetical protein BDA96_02G431100 [Sorghum bicolor]OQU90445.1 hypothetical protein SORBI_3002G410850 [Sorghum bicolor]
MSGGPHRVPSDVEIGRSLPASTTHARRSRNHQAAGTRNKKWSNGGSHSSMIGRHLYLLQIWRDEGNDCLAPMKNCPGIEALWMCIELKGYHSSLDLSNSSFASTVSMNSSRKNKNTLRKNLIPSGFLPSLWSLRE